MSSSSTLAILGSVVTLSATWILAAPAMAAELDYNFIEIGYQAVEIDDVLPGLDVDGDGLLIRGVVEVDDQWYIVAAYSSVDFDLGRDRDTLQLGGGYHVAISDRADLFADLSYLRDEASANGFASESDSGYGMRVGVRGIVADRVELEGSLRYADLGGDSEGTTFSVGAFYEFTPVVHGGVFFDLEEDVTALGVGARIYFGK